MRCALGCSVSSGEQEGWYRQVIMGHCGVQLCGHSC